MRQTQSPLLRLWQLGKDHHGGLIAAEFRHDEDSSDGWGFHFSLFSFP